MSFRDYVLRETRYRRLLRDHPDTGEELISEAEEQVRRNFLYYKHLAGLDFSEFKRETEVEAL